MTDTPITPEPAKPQHDADTESVVDAGAAHPETALAVIIVLTSVVSAGYYLAVVLAMFMRPRPADAAVIRPVRVPTFVVIYASAVVLLFFGLFPAGFLGIAQLSTPKVVATAPASPPGRMMAHR